MNACIYHRVDYDGILSNEVVRHFLKDVKSFGWNNGEPVPEADWASFKRVIMVDIAIEPLMTLPNLEWIDHHASNIAKYPTTIPGYRLDGVAACRLAWHYFRGPWPLPTSVEPYKNRSVIEPLLVTLIGEADIGDRHDERAEYLNVGLRQLYPEEFEYLLQVSFAQPGPTMLSQLYETAMIGRRSLVSAKASSAALLKERAHDAVIEGLNFLVINAGPFGSQKFASGIQPHHDALMSWSYNGKTGRCIASMYTVPDKPINLLPYAEKLGGKDSGGHPNACGFTTTLDKMVAILGGKQ